MRSQGQRAGALKLSSCESVLTESGLGIIQDVFPVSKLVIQDQLAARAPGMKRARGPDLMCEETGLHSEAVTTVQDHGMGGNESERVHGSLMFGCAAVCGRADWLEF